MVCGASTEGVDQIGPSSWDRVYCLRQNVPQGQVLYAPTYMEAGLGLETQVGAGLGLENCGCSELSANWLAVA